MGACSGQDLKFLKQECHNLRQRIVELSYKAGKNGAHVGGSLSLVEILRALMNTLKRDPQKFEARDRLILSKGHGALALYCALEQKGILTKEEAETFETNGTDYFAHAKRNIEKGIEFSGGSLSLGLSYAVGVALGCKAKQLNNHIYVIVGDGECDEGLVWESMMAASKYKLDNLTVIVDCNGLQSDGFTKDVMDTTLLSDKFAAFGLDVSEVDGHDMAALLKILEKKSSMPQTIIAHTVKGKGVSFVENDPKWHHGVMSEKLFEQAKEELNLYEIQQ
jgi:transketolase